MSSSTPPSAPNSGNKKNSGSKNTPSPPVPPPSARETREPSPSAHNNNLDSNSNSNANANSRTSAPPQQPKQKPVPSPRPPRRRSSNPPSNPSNSKPLLAPPRINSKSNSSSNSSSSSEPRPAPSRINSKSNSSSHSNSNSYPLPPLHKSNSNSTTSDTFEPLAALLPGPDYDDPTVVVPSLSENKTPSPAPPTYISSPVSKAPPGPSIIVPSEYTDNYRDMTPPSTGERSMSSSSDTRTLVGGGIVIFIILFFVVIVKWRRSKTDQLLVAHTNPSPKPATVLSYRQGYNNPAVLTTDPFFGQQRISTSSRTRSLTPSHPSGSSHERPYRPTTPTCENNSARANFSLSFTYEEIVDMTGNFSQDNLIGEGGFGCVYKGWMPDGRNLAVKKLKVGNRQGEIEFRAEVETIGRIRHRHLVSLVGYCVVDNHRALVYEFLPNCTLDFHLHGKGVPAIDWERRVKIAVGTVRGLAYLHEECQPRIIHRDIKSANILLDYAFEPQVADFGLAKLTIESSSPASSHIMGTFGYIPPEYASSGKLTDRSDVFSFGVVLLELITGRKPVDTSQPPGHESLVDWARPLLVHALETGEIQGLVDPRLGNNYDYEEIFRMIEAAAACVRHNAIKRPRMIQVKRALVSDGNAMDLANGVNVGQGMAFDGNQYPPNEMQRYRQGANSTESSGEFERQTHRLSNSSGTPRKPLSHIIRP